MSAPGAYAALVGAWFALAAAAFVALRVLTAPYGRHARAGFGPTVAPRTGWVLMETPAAVGVAVCFAAGPRAPLSALFLAMWEAHYAYRSFVFPFLLRSRTPMPLLVVLSGALFNVGNSYLIGTAITRFGRDVAWLTDPRFGAGVALFVAGLTIHVRADRVLRRMRRPGESGYAIPRGGLYRWVSCPNYLGEMIEWWGFALATWSLAGLAFAVFTVANLLPRALDHHRWYRERFPDYPARRKALVPGLL